MRIRHDDYAIDEYATVNQRCVGEDVHTVSTAHDNTLLDTTKYEVQYAGGKTKYITANVITENVCPRLTRRVIYR